MHRSRLLVTVAVTLAAVASAAVHIGEPRAPQKAAVIQGWADTPPSAEAPLEPKPPATVKEGEVWVPPLPSMESVAPPPGWVTI